MLFQCLLFFFSNSDLCSDISFISICYILTFLVHQTIDLVDRVTGFLFLLFLLHLFNFYLLFIIHLLSFELFNCILQISISTFRLLINNILKSFLFLLSDLIHFLSFFYSHPHKIVSFVSWISSDCWTIWKVSQTFTFSKKPDFTTPEMFDCHNPINSSSLTFPTQCFFRVNGLVILCVLKNEASQIVTTNSLFIIFGW